MNIIESYHHALTNLNLSHSASAIAALLEFVKGTKQPTMSELISFLNKKVTELKTEESIGIYAGCDLFMRVLSYYNSDDGDCREYLVKYGNLLLEKAVLQKEMIFQYAKPFIVPNPQTILLTHSYSRTVLSILTEKTLLNHKSRLFVYCTESRPLGGGQRMHKELKEAGIESQLICDSAIGYIIPKVDSILVGAEGVVENGGIVNTMGTYQMAVLSKQYKKPFYVAAESMKFVRLFPLNQSDLHQTLSQGTESSKSGKVPTVDYTPPEYITLLFTDLGVLTPSGVSDELIKLYY